MSRLRSRISSPLEAGTSILDANNLPAHLNTALEYMSKRLARKSVHMTLLVVRKEYQLSPTTATRQPSPTSPGPTSPRAIAFTTSPVIGLRKLVRRGTDSSLASTASSISNTSESTAQSTSPSPTFSPIHNASIRETEVQTSSPRLFRWPLSPGGPQTPRTPKSPLTPATPCSVASSTYPSTATTASSHHESTAGRPSTVSDIRLVYTATVSPRDERVLRTTLAKAERRFGVAGSSWFGSSVLTPGACRLDACLVARSIQQNEELFRGEGLVLLSLDRLYTFKSALAAYSRTCTISKDDDRATKRNKTEALEDAVDDLRRLVLLSRNRDHGGSCLERRLNKGDVLRSYDWLGCSEHALEDVEKMYRRAYGGSQQTGAFFEAPVIVVDEPVEDISPRIEDTPREDSPKQLHRPEPIKIGSPPSPKAPVLKLQTKFELPPKPVRPKVLETPGGFGYDDEDGDITARPRTGRKSTEWPLLHGATIDQILSATDARDQQEALGPMTPQDYDDISPVTRGEWGFLFAGPGWQQGKTAAVETC